MKRRLFKKQPTEHLDVDEVLFDSVSLQERRFRWEHRLETATSPLPMRLLIFAALALVLFFLGRSFWLEIVRGNDFGAMAEKNYIKEVWQRSGRGIIYSSDLVPLVSNTSTFNLVIIPAEISQQRDEQKNLISFLENIGQKDRGETTSFLKNLDRYSFRPVPFIVDLSREEVLTIEGTINSVRGVRLEENFKRKYSDGAQFSHILGYTGLVSPDELRQNPDYLLTDIIGKNGIEASYETELRGEYGKTEFEISSLGAQERQLNIAEPKPGKNLVLFVDSGLQKKLTETIQARLRELGLSHAAAVAIDPRSGGVRALQSFPLYDNNAFSSRLSPDQYEALFESKNRPLLNRAISGLYPPGSTIKPFIGTAGLEENVITAETTVNVTGSITVAGQDFVEFGRRAYGIINLKKAIAVSSNVYFYTLGGGYGDREGLGPYRLTDWLSKFGFGKKLGIDITGEQSGLVPSPAWKKEAKNENWYIGDTYNISIGQGDLLVTPLQLAAATGAIANNGTLIKPRLAKGVGDQSLESITLSSPEILERKIAGGESLRLIREGMRELVLSGSGQILQGLPVTSAGKTGSAQFGKSGRTHAWFTVFAPYENPEIVLTVIVEATQEGSFVAVPIARDVLDWYFNR